jgi:hypothetical protein
VGANLRLGRRVGLGEVEAQVQYRVLRPTLSELGPPDEVYVGEPPPGGQVAFVYRARPGLPDAAETGVGLLMMQFRGGLETDPGSFMKMLGPGTSLEQVMVAGAGGLWIEGRLHTFFYRDARGQPQSESVRLAGNVLLWEQASLTLRLEGPLTKERALEIAASVR